MQPQPPPTMPSDPQPVHYPTVKIERGEDPRGPKYRSTSALFSLNVLHSFIQLCLGGIILYSIDIAAFYKTLSNHIILCTVGYFFLMAQAILSISPVGWANNLKHEHKRIIYAALQTIGSVLAIAGSLIQLNASGFQLNNGHGICGLIAMILTIISFISGIFNIIFSQKQKTKHIKILHSSLSTMAMSVAFICLMFALNRYIGDALMIAVATFAFIGIVLMGFVNIREHIHGDKSVNMK